MHSDQEWERLMKPRKWLLQLESDIDDLVRRGDNVNVWGIPSTGTSTQLGKLSKSTVSKTIFAYIDTQWLPSISPDSFYHFLNTQLAELSKVELEPESGTPLLLTQRHVSAITEKKNLCVIIDTIESLTELPDTFFSSLKALRDRYFGKFCYIFVSNRPIYNHPKFINREEFIDFACHHEIISRPFSDTYINETLPKLLQYFNIKQTPSLEKDMTELSGGILGLLKNILRAISGELDPKIDIETVFEDQAIQNRLQRICTVFTDEELQYLNCLAKHIPPKTRATPFVLRSGMVEQGTIRSKLLKMAIIHGCPKQETSREQNQEYQSNRAEPGRRTRKGLTIDTISGEIFKDGKRLPEILSNAETKVIQLMLENPDSLITRDEVARQLWEDDTKTKYSDWAIDKALSRIRFKIGDTKRPYQHLITIKGKGFKLYSNP